MLPRLVCVWYTRAVSGRPLSFTHQRRGLHCIVCVTALWPVVFSRRRVALLRFLWSIHRSLRGARATAGPALLMHAFPLRHPWRNGGLPLCSPDAALHRGGMYCVVLRGRGLAARGISGTQQLRRSIPTSPRCLLGDTLPDITPLIAPFCSCSLPPFCLLPLCPPEKWGDPYSLAPSMLTAPLPVRHLCCGLLSPGKPMLSWWSAGCGARCSRHCYPQRKPWFPWRREGEETVRIVARVRGFHWRTGVERLWR